jgi:hypothetical protein
LEKYATSKDNNKITYVMVPYDHPTYPFPYNMEDRIKDRIKRINKLAGYSVDILTKKQKNKEDKPTYELSFKNDKKFANLLPELRKMGFNMTDNMWILTIE